MTAARRFPTRGRGPELDIIDGLVADLMDGRGSVLLIEGTPGVGKTRLLAEVAERAARAGGRVLTGRAYDHQRTVPFAPLFGALMGGDPPIGDPASLRALGASTDLRYWVVHELQTVIADAAVATPVLVSIDDAHLADAETLAAIRIMMPKLVDAPILWALSARSGPPGAPVTDAVDTLAGIRPGHLTRVRLSSISDEASADIVGDVLGGDGDQSVQRLTAMAEGNPFLIMELLRGLREENLIRVARGRASVIRAVVPQRLLDTTERRLSSLSSLSRQLVEIAAVLPERFSATHLATMIDARPAELVNVINEAIQADLLVDEQGRLKFRHELIRHAARASIPRALLRALERESAEILLRQGATPEEVAKQMARSAEIGDVVAIESLRRAAKSLATTDPAGAADLSRRAVDLAGGDHSLRGELCAETIDLYIRAARFVEADALAAATLSTELSSETEARVRVSVSMMSTRYPAERVAENRKVLALQGIASETRARNHAWLAYNLQVDGHTVAGQTADEALQQLAGVDDPDTHRLASAAAAAAQLAGGYGRRCATILDDERSAASGSAGCTTAGQLAAYLHTSMLVTLGRIEEANTLLAEYISKAEADGRALAVQLFRFARAMSDHAAGRLTAARNFLEPAFRAPGPDLTRLGGTMVLSLLASIAVETDDRVLIRDTGIAARESADTAGARRQSIAALARAAWHRGDFDSAAQLLTDDETCARVPLWPIDLDHTVFVARVATATGNPAVRLRAEAGLDVLERDPGVPLFCGLARHVRGLLDETPELVLEGAQLLGACERPLLQAAALEDCAGLDHLNRAFDLYRAHGALAGAHRTSRALQAMGVNRRIVRPRTRAGWDSLTASELRVIELIAEGATNPAAARRLQLSPHTINTHLRNSYAKLNISSRAELTRLARGAGIASSCPRG